MQATIQRAFAGGELSPALAMRADQAKYVTGLKTCRNFLVRREGGISNRPGFGYVATVKQQSATCLLLRYTSENAGQSILIEAGVGYFRFYQNGAEVTLAGVAAWNSGTAYVPGDIAASAGVNYYCTAANTNQAPPNATYWYAMPGALLEIPHPFGNDGTLFAWNQSGNVITLTGPNVAPHELVYSSITRWVVRAVTTAPSVAAPVGLAAVAGTAGALSYRYVVTAAAPDTYEESAASASVTVACAKPTTDAPNSLTWTAIADVPEYYVYCDPYGNGTYGFLGTATGAAAFKDIGFVPDFTVTPPLARALFATADDFPKVSAVYQQRRFFANTINNPDSMWASRTGFASNFGISSPLQDDDALTFRIAGNDHHPVRHLVPLKTGLVAMTDGGEWTIIGSTNRTLTPSSIDAEQETYYGANDTRPAVVGNKIVYVQSRGSVVRNLAFDINVNGLVGEDLTIFATHLFNGFTIVDLDFQQVPHSVLWAVRSDGVLLGLTYIPEQQVWGWHRHDTATSSAQSIIEHVCVVPETTEDAVYVIVRRQLNGATVRTVERLEKRIIASYNRDVFFVDSGLSYHGAPANHFTGLDHLDGEVVAVVGDGTVVFNGDRTAANAADFTVTNGAITLATDYADVHIGLPIQYAEIESLALDVQGSDVRSKKKRVGAVALVVDESQRGFFAGPDFDHLIKFDAQPFDGTDPFSGLAGMGIVGSFTDDGRVVVRQVDPLPLTILGLMPDVEVGG